MNRNIISTKKENNINKKIKILRKILNSNKRFRKRGGMCASGGAQSESENPIPKTKGLVFDWKDNSLHYQKPPLPRVVSDKFSDNSYVIGEQSQDII